MLEIHHIGTHSTVPGWPANGTIEGLLEALSRWELDLRHDLSKDPRFEPHPDRKPFRYPALMAGRRLFDCELGCTRFLNGPPAYPEHPTAVTIGGSFLCVAFTFRLTTDDRDLIGQLDQAIAHNLARPALPQYPIGGSPSDEHPNTTWAGEWTRGAPDQSETQARPLVLWDGSDRRPALQLWQPGAAPRLLRGERLQADFQASESLSILRARAALERWKASEQVYDEAYVIAHPEQGVYLGSAMGLGFWSKLDPVGQDAAVVFKSPRQALDFMQTWEAGAPDGVQLVAVSPDQDGYASIDACVDAGLPAWSASADAERAAEVGA